MTDSNPQPELSHVRIGRYNDPSASEPSDPDYEYTLPLADCITESLWHTPARKSYMHPWVYDGTFSVKAALAKRGHLAQEQVEVVMYLDDPKNHLILRVDTSHGSECIGVLMARKITYDELAYDPGSVRIARTSNAIRRRRPPRFPTPLTSYTKLCEQMAKGSVRHGVLGVLSTLETAAIKMFSDRTPFWVIRCIGVREGYRHKGIGTELVNELRRCTSGMSVLVIPDPDTVDF
ncbi:hypothetical protein F4778DRAFT_801678 [Xylariomycetidae sp. FL2044]|nr:hypothetical protein F4778DRAFT_801678 [Xylariomycetidae sp. FL2044]